MSVQRRERKIDAETVKNVRETAPTWSTSTTDFYNSIDSTTMSLFLVLDFSFTCQKVWSPSNITVIEQHSRRFSITTYHQERE